MDSAFLFFCFNFSFIFYTHIKQSARRFEPRIVVVVVVVVVVASDVYSTLFG